MSAARSASVSRCRLPRVARAPVQRLVAAAPAANAQNFHCPGLDADFPLSNPLPAAHSAVLAAVRTPCLESGIDSLVLKIAPCGRRESLHKTCGNLLAFFQRRNVKAAMETLMLG